MQEEDVYDRAPAEPPPPPQPAQSGGQAEPDPVEHEGPPPEFPPEHRDKLTGLLSLGYLEDSFRWAGHTFRIRTLRSKELVTAAGAASEYKGTDAYPKAYQAALVGACTLVYDGKSIPVPVPAHSSEDTPDARAVARMEWCLGLFPYTLDVVYSRYLELDLLSRQMADALGKATG